MSCFVVPVLPGTRGLHELHNIIASWVLLSTITMPNSVIIDNPNGKRENRLVSAGHRYDMVYSVTGHNPQRLGGTFVSLQS